MTVNLVESKLNPEPVKQLELDPKSFGLKEFFWEVLKHLEIDYTTRIHLTLTNRNWKSAQESILNDPNRFFANTPKCQSLKPSFNLELWEMKCSPGSSLNKEMIFSLENKLILVQPLTDDANGYNRCYFHSLNLQAPTEESYIPIYYEDGETSQYFSQSSSIIKNDNLLVIQCEHLLTKWPGYKATGISEHPGLHTPKLLVLLYTNGGFHQIHSKILSSLDFEAVLCHESEVDALTRDKKFYRFKNDGTFSVCSLNIPAEERVEIKAFKKNTLVLKCSKEEMFVVKTYHLETHRSDVLVKATFQFSEKGGFDVKVSNQASHISYEFFTFDLDFSILAKINFKDEVFLTIGSHLMIFNKEGTKKQQMELKRGETFLSIIHDKIITTLWRDIKISTLNNVEISTFKSYGNFVEVDWKWKKYMSVMNDKSKKFELWDLLQWKKIFETTTLPLKFEFLKDRVRLIGFPDTGIEVLDFKL